MAHVAAAIYFALGLLLLAVTVAAYEARLFGPLAWLLSTLAMVAALLIPQLVLLGLVVTALVWRAGGLAHPAGQVGLALHLGCWSALAVYLARAGRALPILDGEPVRDDDHPFVAGLTDDERAQLPPGRVTWRPTLTFRVPAMLDVEVVRDVVYRTVGDVRLRLDVYRPKHALPAERPSLIYVHGGAWIVGSRRQSRFMLYELAAAGFPVFAISYRFAPRFPLPAAVDDCEAAVAWARAHAAEYGARGDRLVAIGGSAGGHLAALLAIAPRTPEARLDGAVVLYGVSDLAGAFDERPHAGMALFLERVVLRRRYRDDPDAFRRVSPLHLAGALAGPPPPMLLVHGSHDRLVPIGQSRRFARALHLAGAPAVHLLEVPMGQHAFEVFPSPLHQRTVRVILRFLESLPR